MKQQFKENTAIVSEQCLLETVNKKAVNHSKVCFKLKHKFDVLLYSWTNIWTYEHGQQ